MFLSLYTKSIILWVLFQVAISLDSIMKAKQSILSFLGIVITTDESWHGREFWWLTFQNPLCLHSI